MKRACLFGAILVIGLAMMSCELPISYGTATLSGPIGGQVWTFVSGTIDADGSVDMTGDLAGFSVMFTVNPIQVGEVRLNLNLFDLLNAKTVTLYDGATNYIVSEGAYEILTVTATEVTGQMNVWDDDNSVNGVFTLTRI
jgi:hypothetical protein